MPETENILPPLESSVTDTVQVTDTPGLHLNAKKAEVDGSLSKEVAKLREDVQFETRVLYIGFAVIFVSVGLFLAQSWSERRASYDTLLDRVDTLQAQVQSK